MKLNKIKKINAASFNNFKWDTHVSPDMERINILLGWNGTGKTVISRILRSFEKSKTIGLPNDALFSLEFDNKDYSEKELDGFKNKIRVFNEDYISKITSEGVLPHVFYLGEDAVDFSEKEKELSALQEEGIECLDTHTSIAEKVARRIKLIPGIATLEKELQGGLYGSYDRASFKKRFEDIRSKISEEVTVESFKLSESELTNALTQLSQQANRQEDYKTIKKIDSWLVSEVEGVNALLQKNIIHEPSERISRHHKIPNEYGWIRDGVKIHNLSSKEESKKTCIFCSNTITNSEELIKHFTEDLLALNETIKRKLLLISSYTRDLNGNFSFYLNERKILLENLKEWEEKIESKKASPTEIQDGLTYKSILLEDHEESNFDQIARKIESHYVAEEYASYLEKLEVYQKCKKQQMELASNIEKVKSELAVLKAKARNTHKPAEKLNRLLRVTFPFKDIQLRESNNDIGYSLYRNKTICSLGTLSEGERNFIALAYFLISLNSVEEEDSLLDNGIVVIDDPVSSLDKNSVFQIFSSIAFEIEKKPDRQYIILTHNLEFFSHLYNHYDAKIREGKVRLLQINLTERGSSITELNKLLKDFKSDYQYATSILWDHRENCEQGQAFLMVNLLRRVWETFLHFKFSSHGNLKSMLEKVYQEAYKEKSNRFPSDIPKERKEEIEEEFRRNKISMYRFINYGSHEFGGVDTIDESILLTAPERIRNFFEIISIVDKHHHQKITTNMSN